MMDVMRRLILVFCALGMAFAAKNAVKNPQLDTIHNIYLLPMGASLDQYLAARLTETGLFQVVTDPQKADAIFTDKIGEGFEQKMEALYPPPEKAAENDEEKDKEKDPWAKPSQRFGSFSKGHGTVYIVERHSRNVVWSMYSPAKSTHPDELNYRATQIVDRLHKDLQGK
jgi:hypothetical protein